MFIFKAGPRKVFRLKPVRCAKKVADPCFKVQGWGKWNWFKESFES